MLSNRRGAPIRSLLFITLACGTLTCSGGGGGVNLCADVTCSGHGTCAVSDGAPLCSCEQGYKVTSDGTRCLPGTEDPCAPYACSNHGRCHLDAADAPYCACDNGYWPSADQLDCLANSCTGDCGDFGCCGTRCCRLVPSNPAVVGELTATGLTKSASGSFDTDAGCTAGAALGNCEKVPPTGSPAVCVCRLDTLTISNLRITGPHALALLAQNTVQIDGTLDLSASGASGGPGAEAQASPALTWTGGKGGSFGTAGGNGGTARGSSGLSPLAGGQNGQAGCGDRPGGGGGGVIQISAGESITVTGVIRALGGAGTGGGARTSPDDTDLCVGGAGGGSGGGALLEAPQVTFAGSFYAHGGGGGGGGNNRGATGENGQDATTATTPAAGGQGRDGASCALYGAIQGGDGGAGAIGDGKGGDGEANAQNMCDPDQPYVGGGGGGGGAGRIRINSLGACNCTGATFSPSLSTGGINKG